MTPAALQPIDRQEISPRLTPLALLYLPVIMAFVGVVRFAVRVGIIRFEPPVTHHHHVLGLYKNRYFRRARAACIRKEYSLMKKTGKPITALTYFPRRHAFLAFKDLWSGRGKAAQFLEEYAREGGAGRVQVFGLSSAHYVVAVVLALLGKSASNDTVLMRQSSLSLAAPLDPAPP